VGRTARAGRRGRAISFVSEADVALGHAAEKVSGRVLEKCGDVTDEMAIKLLGPVAKAARLTKIKLNDIGFDELVQKFKERKVRDRKERERVERALRKMERSNSKGKTGQTCDILTK
jgi:ATP-dependent RNA helicase DDX49/DBP8